MTAMQMITCPTCKKQLSWDSSNPYRPFCCKRCQLIDLGQWANEENCIPGSALLDENYDDTVQ